MTWEPSALRQRWAIPASRIFWTTSADPPPVSIVLFGVSVFHPTQLRQTYFFQDNWKLTPTLALTMGLRYENFGQPANILPYPALSGFDPAQFLVRHEIKPDNKDFGPAFGLAWSPARHSGLLGRVLATARQSCAEDTRSATTPSSPRPSF